MILPILYTKVDEFGSHNFVFHEIIDHQRDNKYDVAVEMHNQFITVRLMNKFEDDL